MPYNFGVVYGKRCVTFEYSSVTFFLILQIFAALESPSVKNDPVFPGEHRIN